MLNGPKKHITSLIALMGLAFKEKKILNILNVGLMDLLFSRTHDSIYAIYISSTIISSSCRFYDPCFASQ